MRVHQRKRWGFLIILFGTSFVIFCLFSSLMLAKENDQLVMPDDPLKGRIIFEKKDCVKCHAVFGYGGQLAPDLGRFKFYGSVLDLASVMWNHSPQMSQQMRQAQVVRPDFSEDEMRLLLAYLYFLPYLGEVGNAHNGKRLLAEKGCLQCHSLGDKGGTRAQDLSSLSKYASPLYMAQAMWNHSPAMESQMNHVDIPRPQFSGQEMVDISAFIRQANPNAAREKIYSSPGNPQRGKQIFKEKGCAQCHASSKTTDAPDLSQSDLKRSVLEISALLWNHGPQMLELMRTKKMRYPKFEGSEMVDLVAYLYFLASIDQKGDPERGKQIFIDKGCSSCHDVTGTTQLIGPAVKEIAEQLSPISTVQIMWNHAGIMQARMLEQNLPWPEFKEGDMKDLYSYLKSFSSQK